MGETQGEESTTTDGPATTSDDGGGVGEPPGDTTSNADDFKPITSQRELEKALKERLDRERSKYRDYGDLKKKAAEFDALVDTQKSELQRSIERAESAEREAQQLRAAREIDGFKAQLSKKYGVPADVLRGSSLEDLEDHAQSLKALLPEPRKPGHVPAEGQSLNPGTGDPAKQFAEILKAARGT